MGLIQSLMSRQEAEQPLSKDGLVLFAVSSAGAIRRISKDLAKDPDSDPFLITLDMLLFNVETRLDNSSTLTMSRIAKLLEVLERLSSWPVDYATPQQPFLSSSYPCLKSLLGDGRGAVRSSIDKLAKTVDAYEHRKTFHKTFKAFAHIKHQEPDSELLDTLANSKPKLGDDTSECLQKLHEVLSDLSRCDILTGKADFLANVALDGITRPAELGGSLTAAIYLRHKHDFNEPYEWKEACIEVVPEVAKTKTAKTGAVSKSAHFKLDEQRRMLTDGCEVAKGGHKGEEICGLCRLIITSDPVRLNLRVSDSKLFQESIERSTGKINLQASGVPLSTVLAEIRPGRQYQELRVHLSYLLANGIWQFYETEWMAESWTKDIVQFMQLQDQALLQHRPFLAVELRPSRRGSPSPHDSHDTALQKSEARTLSPSFTHIFPKILALGIMLLEIELGKDIQSWKQVSGNSAGRSYRSRENESHRIAGDFIESPEWTSRPVYKVIRNVIEICIKPSPELGTDPALMRDCLYTLVVKPLKTLSDNMIGNPQTYNFGPQLYGHLNTDGNDRYSRSSPGDAHATTTMAASSPSSPQPPGARTLREVAAPAPLQVQDEAHESRQTDDQSEDSIVFGGGDLEPDARKCKEANRWVLKFKLQLISLGLNLAPAERIRVAILDTGIDMNHPDVRENEERIKGFESFVEGEAAVDQSGHGTHIAGIILDLTHNVDLYIARISEARRCDGAGITASRAKIVEALKHCRENWKVHMISMSFGYNQPSYPDLVQKEIKACHDKNIVLFASASNDGANRPRTYPSNYPQVLCIHSSSGDGDNSTFSPAPEPVDMKKDNFSTLGDCVKSYWPLPDYEIPDINNKKFKYMSGTSFATPVAVSIAAVMVQYIRKYMPNYNWGVEPMSPEGILQIFRLMSKEHKMHGYDVINLPWFFEKFHREKIQGDFLQELRGVRQIIK